MSGGIEFVGGLIIKAPNPKAPDYVKASISIKREELIAWLQQRPGDWVNLDVKEAKSGKWYAAVNTFKRDDNGQRRPAQKPQAAPQNDGFADDSIPF